MVDIQAFQRDIANHHFHVAAAMGVIPGTVPLIKFGYCETVGLTHTDIWHEGGTYIFPDSAGESIQAYSSDVGDTMDIVIQGLNADPVDGIIGTALEATITLNGTTPVTIPGNWLSVHRAFNDSDTNLIGDVTIDGTVSGNVFAYVPADDNQTVQAIYMIPGDKVGIIVSAISAINATGSPTGLYAVVRVVTAEFGKVFRTKFRFGIQREGTSYEASIGNIPGLLKPLEKVKIQARASVAATDISGYFSVYLIDKYLVPGY